jgi:hypothetical protein
VYKYEWKDWRKAASQTFKGKRNEIINREEVSIYPDTWFGSAISRIATMNLSPGIISGTRHLTIIPL